MALNSEVYVALARCGKGLWKRLCTWPSVRLRGADGSWGAPVVPCRVVPRKQSVTQASVSFLRGQELACEISCLLGIMTLAVFCASPQMVRLQMFMVLLSPNTCIWAACTLVVSST